jgi:hypothetical protein
VVKVLGVEPVSRRRAPRLTRLSRVVGGAVVLSSLAAGVVAWLRPGTPFQHDAGWLGASAVFVSSYVALAIGRVPGLALDRAGVALVGAALMVACGALPLDDAYKAIDLDTLRCFLA